MGYCSGVQPRDIYYRCVCLRASVGERENERRLRWRKKSVSTNRGSMKSLSAHEQTHLMGGPAPEVDVTTWQPISCTWSHTKQSGDYSLRKSKKLNFKTTSRWLQPSHTRRPRPLKSGSWRVLTELLWTCALAWWATMSDVEVQLWRCTQRFHLHSSWSYLTELFPSSSSTWTQRLEDFAWVGSWVARGRKGEEREGGIRSIWLQKHRVKSLTLKGFILFFVMLWGEVFSSPCLDGTFQQDKNTWHDQRGKLANLGKKIKKKSKCEKKWRKENISVIVSSVYQGSSLFLFLLFWCFFFFFCKNM